MPPGQARMLEVKIFGRVVGHAKLFHNPPRRLVRRYCEGDDLAQTETAEAVIDSCARGFIGIAVASIGTRQPPCGLDRRRKRQREAYIAEAHNANKRRVARKLDDPLTKSALEPMRASRRDPRVHGRAVGKGHEILHDSVIGRHLRERLRIPLAPFAQYQARGAQRDTHGYFFLPRPAICERNISCSCSKPLRVAGSQVFSIASGSIALSVVRNRSSTSGSRASCNGFTSGRPKKARASSGVHSMSTLNFIAAAPPVRSGF